MILGTYRLAERFTSSPLLAAIVTLLTATMLVSASSVMCDATVLAGWVWACILWIDGLEKNKLVLLISAGAILGACALTKYFGAALIPLLFVYLIVRQRRLGRWAWCLLIPLVMLAGFEFWTRDLYGQGLITHAAEFSSEMRTNAHASWLARTLGVLSFLGGSMLPALIFAPWLWRRLEIVIGVAFAANMGFSLGWADYGFESPPPTLGANELRADHLHRGRAVGDGNGDARREREANAVLLSLWVLGTVVFAGYVNCTMNVRSVLPLVPAAGILLARGLEAGTTGSERQWTLRLTPALALAALLALWVSVWDAALANAGREAAAILQQRFAEQRDKLWFEGHWGFQYYMERAGFRPVDIQDSHLAERRLPGNCRQQLPTNKPDPKAIVSREVVELPLPWHVTTIRQDLGAAWYSSAWGSVPFAFAPAPPETYEIYRLKSSQK